MKSNSIVSLIGALLIVLGIIGFSYKYYTYTTNEKVAEIGPIKVTAEKEKAVVIPPVLSGLSVAAGIILIVVGVRNRN